MFLGASIGGLWDRKSTERANRGEIGWLNVTGRISKGDKLTGDAQEGLGLLLPPPGAQP